MMTDAIARKLLMAVGEHGDVWASQPYQLDAKVDATIFHEYLKANDIEHGCKVTNRGVIIDLPGGSVLFSGWGDVSAICGRTEFDAGRYE